MLRNLYCADQNAVSLIFFLFITTFILLQLSVATDYWSVSRPSAESELDRKETFIPIPISFIK